MSACIQRPHGFASSFTEVNTFVMVSFICWCNLIVHDLISFVVGVSTSICVVYHYKSLKALWSTMLQGESLRHMKQVMTSSSHRGVRPLKCCFFGGWIINCLVAPSVIMHCWLPLSSPIPFSAPYSLRCSALKCFQKILVLPSIV